jgi:hypothetical protein
MPPPNSEDLEMVHFAKPLDPADGRSAVLGRNAFESTGRLQSSPAAIKSHNRERL